MRIGEFARKAGMEAQTIRFYERRRILPAPRRTASGYRIYETADLENLRLVQRCQELGFTLVEATFDERTPILMGKASDVRPGAILHVTGTVAGDRSLRANRLVVLTGYRTVSDGP